MEKRRKTTTSYSKVLFSVILISYIIKLKRKKKVNVHHHNVLFLDAKLILTQKPPKKLSSEFIFDE